MIGDRTAEQVKIEIGSALPLDEPLRMEVKGRDMIAGLPRTIPITSTEITEAIEQPLQAIITAVRNVLEQTPPELSSDIIDKGMVMTGGGALLRNLDKLLTQVTGIPCHVAENALNSRGRRDRHGARAVRHVPQEPGQRTHERPPRTDGPVTIAATAAELRSRLAEERKEPPVSHRRASAFADFHIHTRFSRDSILTEEKFIAKAIERGLTHVAVTNHNNVEGAIAVRDKVAELGLIDQLTVILGEEVSTADGEVVGIFLTKTIPRGLCANETADEIHRQGGLVSIPHPFDPFRASHIKEGPLRNLAEVGKIDMVEVFNCRVTFQRHNQEAAEFAQHTGSRGSPRPTATRASRSRWPSTRCRQFETADELQRPPPENDWHASRSTVFIHLTTRWAVWKNSFDAWRGKPTATGPILGPATPEQVRREPIQRPTGGAAAEGEGGRMTDDARTGAAHPTIRPHSHEGEAARGGAHGLERPDRRADPRARGQPHPARPQLADDRSILFAIVLLALLFRTLGVNLGDDMGAHRQRERRPFLVLAFVAYYADVPAPRVPLALHPREGRDARPVRDATGDPVPVVVRELPRAGQARRPVSGLPAQGGQRRLGVEDGRHDLHRAHRRHHRHLRLALAAGYWSFRGRSMPGSTSSSSSASSSRILLIGVVVVLRFYGQRVSRFLPTPLRRALGPLPRGQHRRADPIRAARHRPDDGRDLAAGGRAPVLRHPRPRHARREPRHQRIGLRRARGRPADRHAAHAAGIGFVEAGIAGALLIYGVSPELPPRRARRPRDQHPQRDRDRRDPLPVQRQGPPSARRRDRPGPIGIASRTLDRPPERLHTAAARGLREYLPPIEATLPGMLRLLGRTTGASTPMACSAQRSQMTLQTPRSFNAWLRSQLKEKKMSQRQLALQSGVDHSTISRLIKGDRMPSLGTATKLARGLREIADEADGPAYFASLNSRAVPRPRVEYALRGDDTLTEADVRELDAGVHRGPPAPHARTAATADAPGGPDRLQPSSSPLPTGAGHPRRPPVRLERLRREHRQLGCATPQHPARRRLAASQPSSAPGVSMMNVVTVRGGDHATARRGPTGPIRPAPRCSWRSIREPSSERESLRCMSASRSRPMSSSNRSTTAVAPSAVETS